MRRNAQARAGGLRRWFCGATMSALVALTLAAAPTGPAHAAPGDASDAVGRLGACLASGQGGDLLLVLDTSASLKSTDPEARRVDAAAYLVDQLSAYAATSGADLDVAVAGFSTSFEALTPWRPVAEQADSVVRELERYRNRDDGFETDYWSAVDGARRALAKRDPAGDRCQAWVWFSDGRYELDSRDNDAEAERYGTTKPYAPQLSLADGDVARIERAGVSDLCRRGGLADQLRIEDVTTVAVGLGGEGDDYGLVRGIAAGDRVGGSACGQRPGNGAFLPAGDVGDLVLAFDRLSDPENLPTQVERPVCSQSGCTQGQQTFVLDGSIDRVRVLGVADVPDFTAELVAPGGEVARVPSGGEASTQTLGGADLSTASISGDAVEITLARRADEGWIGAWTLTFVADSPPPGATATTNVRLFGDVEPALLGAAPELVSGKSAELQLGLQRASDGGTVDPRDLAGTVSFDAALITAASEPVTLLDGVGKVAISEPVSIDLAGASPGRATLRMQLALVTAGIDGKPGTALEPVTVEVPLTISPPPSYPQVASRVTFPVAEEAGIFSVPVAIQGSGCAWVDGSTTTTLPQGVRRATIDSEAGSEQSCAEGSLPLDLSVPAVGNGLVSGELTVQTVPADGGDPVPVTVAYSMEMQRPLVVTTLLSLLVLTVAVALLIPLLLLYLLKWQSAKIPGLTLSYGTVTGQVTESQAPVLANPPNVRSLRGLALGSSRRQVQVTPRVTLRTKAGLPPTEPGYVRVDPGPSVASAEMRGSRRHRARLPLGVQGHWVAALDPGDPHNGPVEVTFLLAPGSDKLATLVADARAKLPRQVSELRSKLPPAASGGPQPPGRPQLDSFGQPVGPGSSGGSVGGAGDGFGAGSGGSGSSSDGF